MERLAQTGRGNPGSPVLRPFPPFLGGLDVVMGQLGEGVINTEHRNTWPQLPVCSLQPSQRAWAGLSGSESDGYEGP